MVFSCFNDSTLTFYEIYMPFFWSLDKCLCLCAQVFASAEAGRVKLQQNTHIHTNTHTPILFLIPPYPPLSEALQHTEVLYTRLKSPFSLFSLHWEHFSLSTLIGMLKNSDIFVWHIKEGIKQSHWRAYVLSILLFHGFYLNASQVDE